MKRRYLIVATVAAALAVFAAVVWFMDPFLLFVFGVGSLVWIGLPASLFAGIRLFVIRGAGRTSSTDMTVLSMVAVFGCFVGVAIPANDFVQECAVDAAKEYPAQVAPLLEAYRQAHGSYPTSLDQLPTRPAVPRLLRSRYGYRSHGSSYSFSFGQPGGLINSWGYDSRTQKWHLST
jgi:hypothetical protein